MSGDAGTESSGDWLDARFGPRRVCKSGWAMYAPEGELWQAIRVSAGEPRMRAVVRMSEKGCVDVVGCARGVALADFLEATRLHDGPREGSLAPAVVDALIRAVAEKRPGFFHHGSIRVDGGGRLLRGGDPGARDVALLEDAAREVAGARIERVPASDARNHEHARDRGRDCNQPGSNERDADTVDLGALVRGLFPDAVAADDLEDEDLAIALSGEAIAAWSTEKPPAPKRERSQAPLNLLPVRAIGRVPARVRLVRFVAAVAVFAVGGAWVTANGIARFFGG